MDAVEICGKMILLGLSNGEIKISNGIDLQCQAVLKYDQDCGIRCWHCTCAEIIGAYKGESTERIYGFDMKWRRVNVIVSSMYSLSTHGFLSARFEDMLQIQICDAELCGIHQDSWSC